MAVLGAWLAGRLLRMKHEALLVEPGISLALAQDRASRVSSLSYVVTLRVPAALTDAVTGHVTATFDLSDASRPLAFDFSQPAAHLLEARAGGRAVTPAFSNGHVTVPATQLVAGANTVEFAFVAGSEALNRSDDLLYSLFVPARASQTFPCFDQPDVKARWQLSLEVPPGWTAVSNGREEGRVTTADHTGYSFAQTELLPTYLFAFAAGRFSVEAGERDGRIFRLFHRETDRRKLERNLDAIFHLHAEALAWLSTYTGIPYPFGKFDLVLIPSFQFGGMEHPGAVYYNASALLLDEAATQNQHLARADVIAHETAHMWFGNLVTMRWFDDVWMKEVFAGFYAACIVNPSFPGINHDLRFLLQHYPAAYDVDRTDGANPIRQELDNLQDAGALYGAIIYQKAPIVMRQLEQVVGADVFQAAVRQYLSSAMYGNAGWPEFVGTLDARTPADVSAWSRAWVTEGGRPTITTDLRIGEGRIVRLAFTQSDPRGRPLIWPERLRVLLGWDDRTEVVDATIDAAEVVITSAAGQPTPRWVLPVGGGLGYGFFALDSETLSYLTHSLHRIGDPLTRGAAIVALWDAMVAGDVAPHDVLQALVAAVAVEPDELNLQQMLDYASTGFWRFTAANERAAVAARLEPALRAGLSRAQSTSARAAWFHTLRTVAVLPETLEWLTHLWGRKRTVPGLPLSESDEADLALDLALRDLPHAGAWLDAQLGRMENPDRRARFAFIMPSASAEEAVRDRFFESLRTPAGRARESWVVDALRYFNHPLRVASSQRHLHAALERLQDVQRTGDIFFPKRWADAVLSGYQTPRAAADVRAFIAALPPDYPPRLRWVLQSAADPLFRAARHIEAGSSGRAVAQ